MAGRGDAQTKLKCTWKLVDEVGGSGEDLYPSTAFVVASRVAAAASPTLSDYLREEREVSDPRVMLFFPAEGDTALRWKTVK